MPMEYTDRPRTTHRNMRVSVLLILITVGLPGCAGAAGTSRPAAVRHPATNPSSPSPPTGPDERTEPDPGLADPSGHGGAANPALPTDTDRTGWPGRRLGPWHRLPAQNTPETPEPGTTPAPATRPDERDSYPAPAGPARPPGDDVGEQHAAPPPPTGGPPPGYQRSLAYSGLFGLVISAVGLAMVGSRRRYW
ncbi:hypothetical protein [Plantactinospora endophytica]|uniref:Uncharacterized protein n=1 Tax=Plantactinospora endophytica TaxID=673535 RepID=A0ABQ4E380_9ACTN|nr:hypothetical protein [Plantactinospora endophytica]GIG89166.1 hypothetical protein Pen02_41020 [Plantactinospora endophytica]